MSSDAVDSRSSGRVMKLVVLPSRLLLLEQYNMYMYAYRLVFCISHDSRACGMPRLTRLSRVCGKDQSAFHLLMVVQAGRKTKAYPLNAKEPAAALGTIPRLPPVACPPQVTLEAAAATRTMTGRSLLPSTAGRMTESERPEDACPCQRPCP